MQTRFCIFITFREHKFKRSEIITLICNKLVAKTCHATLETLVANSIMQCVYCKTMANLPTATTTLLGSVKLQVLSGYWQDIVRGLERTQPFRNSKASQYNT